MKLEIGDRVLSRDKKVGVISKVNTNICDVHWRYIDLFQKDLDIDEVKKMRKYYLKYFY